MPREVINNSHVMHSREVMMYWLRKFPISTIVIIIKKGRYNSVYQREAIFVCKPGEVIK